MATHRLRPVRRWQRPLARLADSWLAAVLAVLATWGLTAVAARLVPALAVVALLAGSTGQTPPTARPGWYGGAP